MNPIDPTQFLALGEAGMSDALVICNSAEPELVEAARTGESGRHPAYGVEMSSALNALNRFVLAYFEGTGNLTGGPPLKKLSLSEFWGSLRQTVMIATAKTAVDEADVLRWLEPEAIRPSPFTGGALSPDLSAEALAKIPEALNLVDAQFFRELAFEAKSLAARTENIYATLLAMAALEGAHAAYFHSIRRLRFPDLSEELGEDMLREMGLARMLQVTCAMFMKPDERPTEEELAACLSGNSARNNVMHSLRAKGGKAYKARLANAGDFARHPWSILAVYKKFVDALDRLPMDTVERRLDDGPAKDMGVG